MAEIVSDGVRAWATDTLDRKLGRVFAAAAGAAMLWAVFVISPGPARIALAVGSVVLSRLAAMPRPEVTVEDLAEIESAVLALRSDVDERTEVGFARLDRLVMLVSDIRRSGPLAP